ncbi:MAG: AMP-dependent synthetase/ligase [Thiobacillus sp.]
MAAAFHPDEVVTLYGLFQARVAASPGEVAYRQYDAKSETWLTFTWEQVGAEVARWQKALVHENLAPGDRVAVMLKNCVEWVIFDQAALGLGLVTVPLYLDDSPENAAYILDHADARLLLIEGKFQHRKVAEIAAASTKLEVIISLEAPEGDLQQCDKRFVVASDWLQTATDVTVAARGLSSSLLASIVYTSGTTGRAKGVMLTHANFLWNAHSATQCISLGEQDVYLSFLPLSHTLERMGGYYWPMMLGAEVVYARSVTQLAQDLLSVRPTVLISVPRIYERVYGRIQNSLAQKKTWQKKLFNLTVEVGWQRFEIEQGRAGWHPQQLLWPLLNRLVARNIVEKLGGRLKVAVSGGAALSPEIARTFVAMGVPLYQGYGLTETSPVICVNRPASSIPTGIGQALPGVEVKIGADDELLTRSRCVMRGYWKNEAATRDMIDADGWLRTGDKASVDAKGHYTIIGRIKDIIVLSNGEKISPSDMEAAMLLDPLFDQVMIVGEGRPYLAALLVLNAELWPAFAQELGQEATPAALKTPPVLKALKMRVNAQLKHFPGHSQIRHLHPDLAPWTTEGGLLTPTLKVKRNRVFQHYQSAIETLYADFKL